MGNNGMNETTKGSPPERPNYAALIYYFLFVFKQALTMLSWMPWNLVS